MTFHGRNSHELEKFLQILTYSMTALSDKDAIKIANIGMPMGILPSYPTVESVLSVKEGDQISTISPADVRDIDLMIIDYSVFNSSSFEKLLNLLDENSIVLVHGILTNIYKTPYVIRHVIEHGFTKALLSIGSGVMLLAKKAYDKSFLNKTVEVYRESFIQGPNPIHYNTAYLLYVLVRSVTSRAKRGIVVEVGTGRGFSTMWLGITAHMSGIKVLTFEIKEDRMRYATKILGEVGLDKTVKLIYGDVREQADIINNDIVFLFIDGWKREYHEYLEALEDKLSKGSLIVAHNTVSNAHEMEKYLNLVYSKEYMSLTLLTDPAGVTISAKT